MADEIKSLEDLGNIGNATGDGGDAVVNTAPVYEQKLDAYGRAYATGKRKNAVARVWIKPGSGQIVINKREFEKYFARPVLRMILTVPRTAPLLRGVGSVVLLSTSFMSNGCPRRTLDGMANFSIATSPRVPEKTGATSIPTPASTSAA